MHGEKKRGRRGEEENEKEKKVGVGEEEDVNGGKKVEIRKK